MRVSYGKTQWLVLLLSLLIGGGILFGIYLLWFVPLREENEAAQMELQIVEQRLQLMLEEQSQLAVFEGISISIDDIEGKIPVGDLQILNLLKTLENAAEFSSIELTGVQVGETSTEEVATSEQEETETESDVDFENLEATISAEDEEFNETSTLTRTRMSLEINGENEDQLQSFIKYLEQSARLIQVTNMSVNQRVETISEMVENPDFVEEVLPPVRTETDITTGASVDLETRIANERAAEIEAMTDSSINTVEREIAVERSVDVMSATLQIMVYFTN